MNPAQSLVGACPLAHWGVIRARGADAAAFLHGQLTNSVTALDGGSARLAGYCSPKGRLLASLVMWRDTGSANAGDGPADVLLACHRSVLAATLKRLSMFVMRAKCVLTDASAERPLIGLAGPAAAEATAGLAVWGQRRAPADAGLPHATWIRLPDADGVPRALCAAPESGTWPAPVIQALPLSVAAWQWLEVASGVPVIEAATADRFVPQMLNLELIGGVDFQKGCYPGQEVVARSQYRGTVKRRMFRFDVATVPVADVSAAAAEGDGAGVSDGAGSVVADAARGADNASVGPGIELFHSADPSQPAGMVCNAAAWPGGAGWALLAEVKLAALDTGSLHLGGPSGPALLRAALPYDVPAAEAASA